MTGKHIRALRGGRWRDAIDCGDETVIQLEDEGGGARRILRSYRPEFVSGAEVVEVVPHREGTFPPEEVVARAYSLMGDPAAGARFPDPASFAEWCATGREGGAGRKPAATVAQRTRKAPKKPPRRKTSAGPSRARRTRPEEG